MRNNISKFKNLIFYINVLIFTSLILNLSLAATPEELRNAIEQKSRELQEISNKIKENQKNLEQIQNQSKTLTHEIKNLDDNINQINLGIRYSEVNIEKLNLEINSLQYDINEAETDINSKREAIIKIIQEFQKKDNETPLLIFLKNKSLSDSVFEAQNLTDLNTNLKLEIENIKQAKEKMTNSLNQSTNKKQLLEIENNNLKNKKLILNDIKKEKNIILTQTKNQEKIYQNIINDLQKKQIEIAQEIDKLEESLRLSFNPDVLPTKRAGILSYPLNDVSITQEYGYTNSARMLYRTKFHNGVDFEASIGTPVLAADDGEVIAVGNNGRLQYGKFVLIKHNNNLATLYAHLSKQVVQKGEIVKRGEVLGYSGNTGYSTGPHLHFGVYWLPTVTLKSFPGAGLVPVGVTVNPLDYL